MARIDFGDGSSQDFFTGFSGGSGSGAYTSGPTFRTQDEPTGGVYTPPDPPPYIPPNTTPTVPTPTVTTQPLPRTTAPTPTSDPGTISPYDAVASIYRNALGRDPESADVVNSWLSGLHGNIAAIQQAIYGSPEAKAYGARNQGTSATGTPSDWPADLDPRIAALYQKYGVAPGPRGSGTTDYQYWQNEALHNANGDWNYVLGRIEGDLSGGKAGIVHGPEGPAGSAGPNAAGMGYDDPSANIYLSQLMSRLNQLNTPQHDPWEDILKLFALQRVQSLNGAPYTSGDDAALIAHYRDPMTQARDQAKQQKAEDLARRGITPNSPLFQHEMSLIDQGYERGLATADNTLGVQAVQEKQRRADEQLSILNSILGVNRTGVDRTNALADRAVQVASMFPAFDQSRLDMLLKASGEGAASPSSLISGLNGLGGLGLNSSIYQNQQDAATAAFWGNLIASIAGGFR